MIFLFTFCQLILTFSFPVTCCENTYGCQHKVSTNGYNSIPDFIYSEGKLNIKAGYLLWLKNLSLSIFSKTIEKIRYICTQFQFFISPKNIFSLCFFSYILQIGLAAMFFRKFNIKGPSCISFHLASLVKYLQKYLQMCPISSLTTNYFLKSKKL